MSKIKSIVKLELLKGPLKVNEWLERFEIIHTSYTILYESGTKNYCAHFIELPKQAKKIVKMGGHRGTETKGAFYTHRTTIYYNYT